MARKDAPVPSQALHGPPTSANNATTWPELCLKRVQISCFVHFIQEPLKLSTYHQHSPNGRRAKTGQKLSNTIGSKDGLLRWEHTTAFFKAGGNIALLNKALMFLKILLR